MHEASESRHDSVVQLVFGSAADADLDAEQRLALAYVPRARRVGLCLLWQLDTRMHRIFSSAREPAIAEIKLAWWEERLGGLQRPPIPAEPLLQRLAEQPEMQTADLAGIAEAWRNLLDDSPPSADALGDYARMRGRSLVRLGAAALGSATSEAMLLAGEGYAFVDLAGFTPDPQVRTSALTAARERYRTAGRFTWPRTLRPFGMIVELARGDAMAGRQGRSGSPIRVARMAWHAISGR